MCQVYPWCPQKPEDSNRFPEIRASDTCELHGHWELNLGPLHEQQVLLLTSHCSSRPRSTSGPPARAFLTVHLHGLNLCILRETRQGALHRDQPSTLSVSESLMVCCPTKPQGIHMHECLLPMKAERVLSPNLITAELKMVPSEC